MSVDYQLQPFDFRNASEPESAAMNRHINRHRKEQLPDDPPVPLEEHIQNWKTIPPFAEIKAWAAWNSDQTEIVAEGEAILIHMDENKHLAQFDISVDPEYRCQGLARQLIARIAADAKADGRRLLLTETSDRIPAGEAFLSQIGGERGLETHTNQLRIEDLDRSLLEKWLVLNEEKVRRFEIDLWEGPYPEEQIDAIVKLFDVANQQPLGNLEIEDIHMTAEQLRQSEVNMLARGNQRWTFYVIEKETGNFAGYTETVWNPNRPEILRQDMTGVFPEYRKNGLGRWLKAAMLDKVLRDRPQVKYVRTGNADSNAAMLKINQALGFKPYYASTLWQVEISKIEEYLKDR